ncbi:MAG: hypothetical protein DDT42_01702 [candidate division WS2 bacterium]|uniref:Uncharacterized protein n=1 Tax=Psychracetigena formicireducens TaxID=2986056 RepID=A0A9E2BJV7_PSYF1|nr:hypothetical protein [Candidatus Psychracetigena formicireducens]
MELTENDVPICKVLFNEETHAMALAMYGDRAKEIYNYVCDKGFQGKDFFGYREGIFWRMMLLRQPLADFFFDNNLINFGCLDAHDICYILKWSSVCGKIWDSGRFDSYLDKLKDWSIEWILAESPISDKIKASGKLKIP